MKSIRPLLALNDGKERALNGGKGWLAFVPFMAVIVVALAARVFIERAQDAQAHAQRLSGLQVIRPPQGIQALVLQGQVIWAGGKEGVVGLDRASGAITQTLDCDVPLRYVRALLLDREGVLWIGHAAGLSRYDPQSRDCRTLTTEDGLPDQRVNALYLDRDGRLWVGTWEGVAFLDEGAPYSATTNGGKGAWQTLNAANGLADDMVNVITQDSRGGMWFGSAVAPQGGLSYCRDGRCQQMTTAHGLPHNNINAILQDQAGDIWVGAGFLDRGGAARLRPTADGWAVAEVLAQKDGLAGAKVRSLLQDRQGMLWFGSEDSGLARREAGRWRILTVREGLAGQEVTTMTQDEGGDLWLGGPEGLTRVSAATLATWW